LRPRDVVVDVHARRLTPRRIAVPIVVTVTLAVCGSASSAILFSTVAKGRAHSSPEIEWIIPSGRSLPIRQGAFLARTPDDVSALAPLLRPEEREMVLRLNWRRYLVVAAVVDVPMLCYAADVARVARKRATLVVSVVVTHQGGGCFAAVGRLYQVIKVRRAASRTLPRRAVLKVTAWV
jgi:hypothetical protein